MTGASMGCFMTGLLKLAAGVATAAILGASSAQAGTWLLTYQSSGGSPFAATLDLVASDTLDAAGGYDVTSISGHVDGDTVTGLIANPDQPFAAYSADGLFIFDNVIWPAGAPQLSHPGLFFSGFSGDEYNLFSDNASTYELYKARPGSRYLANSVGTISLTQTRPSLDLAPGAIPEPAAWALMILGFGGVGAMLRHRRASAGALA
jgi:PEP-CTERM motif-containing protein